MRGGRAHLAHLPACHGTAVLPRVRLTADLRREIAAGRLAGAVAQ